MELNKKQWRFKTFQEMKSDPAIEYQDGWFNHTSDSILAPFSDKMFELFGQPITQEEYSMIPGLFVHHKSTKGPWQIEYWMITDKPLPEPTKETRKIIGYKCPMDLYGGDIKKGVIIKEKIDVFYKVWTNGNARHGASHLLPAEIVETWEPIYEDKFYSITSKRGNDAVIKFEIEIAWDITQAEFQKLNNELWKEINRLK